MDRVMVKNKVTNNLEDGTYEGQGCKQRWRSSAPVTLMHKRKEHPHHTHPDPPHGRHDLHPAVRPWHIQTPNVL